jgi:uncharacterized Ntn-hydrolase superfamily protein
MTFSIVARDNESGELGIAVQSKFISVGSVVPWIDLKAGAIATQAMANLEYGRMGLKLLASGLNAQQILKVLIDMDPEHGHRQLGIVDTKGNAVTFTGKYCYDWAGGVTADGVAAQGNILVSEATVNAMLDTYLKTKGDLAEKLLSALEAGQKAGGDKRGQQSANLLVYKKNGGYGGGSDRYIDVRVDDHPQATSELRRIFSLYSMTLLEREDPKEITELTADVYRDIGAKLKGLGYLDTENFSEQIVRPAFTRWIHTENFENKERKDNFVWNSILNHLKNM